MIMAPGIRKGALVVHVSCSVGWLGAVLTSLVLAVAGLISQDGEVVRAAYLTLWVIGWYALVPFSIAALLSGLVQSLGTVWGLLRHYWVIFKLLLNVVATAVLLIYMQTLTYLADTARTAAGNDLEQIRSPSPVLHGMAAVGLLLVALVLSVYKPRGVTGYGQRVGPAPDRAAASRRSG